MIDFDIQQQLQPELTEGEKLLWTGRPRGGIIFRRADWFVIPFSIIWCSIVITMIVTVALQGAPVFIFVMLIPFAVVGGFISIGRFWLDTRRRANTIYGITDSRIITRSGRNSKVVNSFNIKQLGGITLNERQDGSGTIVFTSNSFGFNGMSGRFLWQNSGTMPVPSLEVIDNVREVYNLILKLQNG